MKIYLVRHGETNWNKEGRIQGQTDIPLNAEGVRLAELTAAGLSDVPFTKAYSSPLTRARQTAEIISGEHDGLEPVLDSRIMEMNFGAGEGQSIEEIRENPDERLHNFIFHPQFYAVPPEGGETFGMLRRRAVDFMETTLRPLEPEQECVLVASHGGLIREILCWVDDTPRADFWRGSPQPNCAVNILECVDGKFRILEAGRVYYDSPTARILN